MDLDESRNLIERFKQSDQLEKLDQLLHSWQAQEASVVGGGQMNLLQGKFSTLLETNFSTGREWKCFLCLSLQLINVSFSCS